MNPFTDWKPEQQCRNTNAVNSKEETVLIGSPEACQWCANGIAIRNGVPYATINKFETFLIATTGQRLTSLNDYKGWLPYQFAAAWDEFQKEEANASA
jgi:hypothetical protein